MAMAMAPKQADKKQLPIRILRRCLVKASDPCPKPHVAAFSNLDLYPDNVQASLVCLYPRPPMLPNSASSSRSFEAVVSTFQAVLPSLLSRLYPLAGRIIVNPASGLPELHCHNQGAELVVGQVDVALGSLDYGLAEDSLKKMVLPYQEDLTLSVQLLSFACGGFSVVWGHNNLVCDGNAVTTCTRMWSQLARSTAAGKEEEEEEEVVNHDRSMFQPRNPPAYGAAMDAMFATYDDSRMVNALTAQVSFVERLYYIDARDIAKLRKEAAGSSRVQAMSAYLWKALADVVASSSRVPEERCCMGWMVDGRRRVKEPGLVAAMRNYFGNVTAYAIREAAVEEIRRKPLAEVAAMVRDSINSVDYDTFLQELVDWVEEHKTEHVMEKGVLGMGTPTVNQTVFASFPLDTDFGFGDAALALPMCDYGRLCSGYLSVGARPGGDGSWILSAYIWPNLAAALDSDGIFKPLTAHYLGLSQSQHTHHLRPSL